jgi:magnesium transporter
VASTCRLFRDGKLVEEGFDPALVSDYLEEDGTLVWLDFENPTDEELGLLQEELSLHPLVMEDIHHRNQRPKVEAYEDVFFVVTHNVRFRDEEFENQEVHCLVSPRYFATFRYAPVFDPKPILTRAENHPDLTAEGGGFLLYALLDEVVDRYFHVVEAFEDASEGIEEQVFADETQSEVQEQIFQLKKQVMEFRRLVTPVREVLEMLQAGAGIVTPVLRAYYRDVADHVIRVLEFVNNVRELLTTALEAHLSQVSNRLNQVMKQLTSWAAIILVPTLIAGVYGMNFRHMPELNWLLGYPFALGLMVVSAGMLFMVFKRRGWL